jgi:hypothetical protein
MRPETVLGALALFSGFSSVVLLVVFLHSVRRRRNLSALLALLAAVTAGLISTLAVTVLVGTRGYSALTREETAAWIRTVPDGEQRFVAHFRLPDGRLEAFEIAGDELYVDAHILKWKSVANLLGLHTAYELDRVAGRYSTLDDERHSDRTVYSLAPTRSIDLFYLRRASEVLAPLVDAEYGSASFIAARDTALWELRVSTSGLLLRQAELPGD